LKGNKKMTDYAPAIPMYVPSDNVFIDQIIPKWVVIHKTASGGTAQDIANFFAHDPKMASTHYVVGMDGTVVQCVAEKDGAGGNCCLETGHDSFWPTNVDLNWFTISIEHVDPTSDNSTPLTYAQKQASFLLVADICKRHSIPAANIYGHNSIAPVTRARCPGNYPLDELRAYVNSQVGGVPIGWTDDGTTLKAPNGMVVVKGFRARVLEGWDATNVPLENERAVAQVEHANPAVGGGSIQTFVNCRLGWTATKGVYMVPAGAELMFLDNL
jgi:hypothetical protein